VNGFLLDTNVLSEFSPTCGPDPRVKLWLRSVPGDLLRVSVLTLAEIQRGIELLPPGKRRTQLEEWLRETLVPWFDEPSVLPITWAIAQRWAMLSATAKKKGTPLALIDGLLAATALEHDLTLVTRDKDFSSLVLPILNPWNSPLA
jgi:toxin FitB